MDVRERARKMLADIDRGGSGFFNPHKCTSDTDEGDSIRLLYPDYLKERGLDPWIAYKEWSILVPGKAEPHRTPAPFQYGLPDPIKDLVEELESDNPTEAASYKLGDKFASLVEFNGEVMPWTFGPMIARQILKLIGNPKWPLLWDNEVGRRINVRKTGEKLKTKYEITPDPTSEPLDNAAKIMAKANATDLSNCIAIETEETFDDILNGEYNKDVAKERREARDKAMGRKPIGPFVTKSAAVATGATKAKSKAAESKDELPYEDIGLKARTKSKTVTATTAADSSLVGRTATFVEDGEEYVGEVVKEWLDKGRKQIRVNVDGEAWDMPVTEAEIAEPESVEPDDEPDAEPEPAPRAKRVAAQAGAAKNNALSKVREIQERARKTKGK